MAQDNYMQTVHFTKLTTTILQFMRHMPVGSIIQQSKHITTDVNSLIIKINNNETDNYFGFYRDHYDHSITKL